MPWWPRHRIGRAAGTKPFPFSEQCRHREGFHSATEMFGSAVAEVAVSWLPTGLRSSLRESRLRAPNTPGGTPCCSTRRTSGSPIPRSVGSRSPSMFLPPTATGPLGVGDQCAVSEGKVSPFWWRTTNGSAQLRRKRASPWSHPSEPLAPLDRPDGPKRLFAGFRKGAGRRQGRSRIRGTGARRATLS